MEVLRLSEVDGTKLENTRQRCSFGNRLIMMEKKAFIITSKNILFGVLMVQVGGKKISSHKYF